MTEVNRLAPPSLNVPKIRKKMPEPFSRPSISIGGGVQAKKRQWQHVLIADVQIGDVVAGHGLVTDVHDKISDDAEPGMRWFVILHAGENPEPVIFKATDTVYAFTA